jgi:outer membrane protein
LQGVRAQYRRIVGVEAGSLEPPPPAPILPAGLDEAVAIALDSNPDVRRLLQAEKAATQQVRIERSSLLPSVGIVSRIDRGYDSPSRGIDSDTTTTSAQVTIPLFEGGLANSRTRAARIGVERARQQTEETRRAVVAQVTRAWGDHLAAQRVIESSQKQLRANELAFEGVQEEQKVGLRTTLDVLNAQQELLNAQLAVVSAERDAYVAAHAVLSSMGRLDAEALSVNSPLYDPDEHRQRVRRTILSTFPAGVR